MKKGIHIVVWLAVLVAGVFIRAEAQEGTEYTFITGTSGSQVCLGRWFPPKDPALTGVCQGQLFDVGQFTAVSAMQSAGRLDQMLRVLTSIDQRLAVGNEQTQRLLEATGGVRAAIDQQPRQDAEALSAAINERFNALPEEIVASEQFREELEKLREDILKEVEKRLPAK